MPSWAETPSAEISDCFHAILDDNTIRFIGFVAQPAVALGNFSHSNMALGNLRAASACF